MTHFKSEVGLNIVEYFYVLKVDLICHYQLSEHNVKRYFLFKIP